MCGGPNRSLGPNASGSNPAGLVPTTPERPAFLPLAGGQRSPRMLLHELRVAGVDLVRPVEPDLRVAQRGDDELRVVVGPGPHVVRVPDRDLRGPGRRPSGI